jgi:hypothetical protein
VKGIFFQKPLEYNLETNGEKWRQGETINGFLRIKNHTDQLIESKIVKVALLTGNYKKVKTKDPNAFEFIAEQALDHNVAISGSTERLFNFEFKLLDNCRITDKDGSVYLALIDNLENNFLGNIELTILPREIILQFLGIMDNFIRFKIGTMKYSKGMVEVKLTPPLSKEFSQVDNLVLRMNEKDKNLHLEYLFSVKKIEMVGSSMTTEKKVLKLDQVLTAKQFYIYGDSVNQDLIIEQINLILKEVKPKFLI